MALAVSRRRAPWAQRGSGGRRHHLLASQPPAVTAPYMSRLESQRQRATRSETLSQAVTRSSVDAVSAGERAPQPAPDGEGTEITPHGHSPRLHSGARCPDAAGERHTAGPGPAYWKGGRSVLLPSGWPHRAPVWQCPLRLAIGTGSAASERPRRPTQRPAPHPSAARAAARIAARSGSCSA
jgi:hypothetical protein